MFWKNSTETLGCEYNNTIGLGIVFIYKTQVAGEHMTWTSTLRQPDVQVLDVVAEFTGFVQRIFLHGWFNTHFSEVPIDSLHPTCGNPSPLL
jgi:hypothetical protein